jgi:flagellar biosynthesis protein FliQ
MQIRRTAAALTSAAALTVTGVAMASPATAAPNNANQTGLVNLALQDTTVQVPIALAANICGVAVNILATATDVSDVTCRADGVSTAENQPGDGANNANQTGLVNLAVQGTTVQVPVAVAANVCGVGVNAVAAFTQVAEIDCAAVGGSEAQA